MKQQEFDELVARIEPFAQADPKVYRLRVSLFAALGYAYIGLVMIVIAALIGGIVAIVVVGHHANGVLIKPLLILAGLLFVTIRSLFISIPVPDGAPIAKADAPKLFEDLREMALRLQAPGFHHVIVDQEFNAAVVQRPLFGLFGPIRNYLVIGLPLMSTLTPNQFRSILAHELGHASANHSQFAGKIYRIRSTWDRLLAELSNHKSAIVFERFFRWYAPHFSAYTFVLARQDEYVADRCAVELFGLETFTAALVRISARSQVASDFVAEIEKAAVTHATPPADFHRGMIDALQRPMPPDKVEKLTRIALNELTDTADTHPSLTDRIHAVGGMQSRQELTSIANMQVQSNALDYYLGDKGSDLVDRFDKSFAKAASEPWTILHKEAQKNLTRLIELDRRADAGETLNWDEKGERAKLTADLRGDEDAIPLFQAAHSERPDDAECALGLGLLLLEKEDHGGIALIDQAMKLNPSFQILASAAAFKFLTGVGKPEEALNYRNQYHRSLEALGEAEEETHNIRSTDLLVEHEMSSNLVDRLREMVAGVPTVDCAYLVKKALKTIPAQAPYVLVLKLNTPSMKFVADDAAEKMINDVGKRIDGFPEPLLVTVDSHYLSKAKGVPNALIYSRKWPK